jgi:hypothetical protein
MSDPSRPSPAGAGPTLVATMLLTGAVGFGIGTLVDFAVPLGLVGLFAGVLAGFALVYSRFRDL